MSTMAGAARFGRNSATSCSICRLLLCFARIDEAASRVRINFSTAPLSVKEATKMLESVRNEKDEAISSRQYEYAAELRDREANFTEKLAELEKDWKDDIGDERPSVTEEDISEVVSMWTGIPVTRLAMEESERLVIWRRCCTRRW